MGSSFADIGRPIATQTEKSVERISETHANQVVEQTTPVDSEEFIHVGDRKWNDIHPVDTSTETLFLPRSRNLLSDGYAIMTCTKETQTSPFIGIL